MSQRPIHNPGPGPTWVNNVMIPEGETKVFEEAELPPHLRQPHEPKPLPTEPDDPLLELLDQPVATIVKAIEERDEQGKPVLSDDELIRLGEAEANGKTRKTLMKALDEERVTRADEAQKAEDLAVFAASLEDMPAEQLEELKKTHQEDAQRVAAIEWQEFKHQVNAAVVDNDREMLQLMLEDTENEARVERIKAAQAELDGGGQEGGEQ